MFKKVSLLTLVLILLATSFVFADDNQSVLSKVTGISDEEILNLRESRVGYGRILTASLVAKMTNTSIKDVLTTNQQGTPFVDIAKDKGIDLEEYKKAMLEGKLSYVDQQLKAGLITEAQANLIKERLTTNIENCNGQGLTRTQGLGQGQGFGLGKGSCGNGMVGAGRGFRNNGARFNNSIFNQ